MNESFRVTAWTNGSPSTTGSGFGLKLTVRDRDKYFKKSIKSVMLYLSGESEFITVNTDKPSFWNGCRELISKDIGAWLIENNMDSWPKGHPPKFTLVVLTNNEFRLEK